MDFSTSHHHPDPVHCADSLHAYAQPITNPPKFLKIFTYIAGVRKRTLRGAYKCYLK
ncbi:hypothetical protein Lepto7375DRAFT_0326 [Leptolyngbya sp. PCC 7375]|nr:hypothetical protein Lepto7375DRAFT_0326 [Leptolyngbya sp. PCC 7375]